MPIVPEEIPLSAHFDSVEGSLDLAALLVQRAVQENLHSVYRVTVSREISKRWARCYAQSLESSQHAESLKKDIRENPDSLDKSDWEADLGDWLNRRDALLAQAPEIEAEFGAKLRLVQKTVEDVGGTDIQSSAIEIDESYFEHTEGDFLYTGMHPFDPYSIDKILGAHCRCERVGLYLDLDTEDTERLFRSVADAFRILFNLVSSLNIKDFDLDKKESLDVRSFCSDVSKAQSGDNYLEVLKKYDGIQDHFPYMRAVLAVYALQKESFPLRPELACKLLKALDIFLQGSTPIHDINRIFDIDTNLTGRPCQSYLYHIQMLLESERRSNTERHHYRLVCPASLDPSVGTIIPSLDEFAKCNEHYKSVQEKLRACPPNAPKSIKNNNKEELHRAHLARIEAFKEAGIKALKEAEVTFKTALAEVRDAGFDPERDVYFTLNEEMGDIVTSSLLNLNPTKAGKKYCDRLYPNKPPSLIIDIFATQEQMKRIEALEAFRPFSANHQPSLIKRFAFMRNGVGIREIDPLLNVVHVVNGGGNPLIRRIVAESIPGIATGMVGNVHPTVQAHQTHRPASRSQEGRPSPA